MRDVRPDTPSAGSLTAVGKFSLSALIERERHVLGEIAAGVPLKQVLEDLIHAVEAQSEHGLIASVLLISDDGLRLEHGAGPSLPDTYNKAVDGIAIGEGIGSCGTAAALGQPVYVTDIATDPLWKDFSGLALGHGLRACWSMPIRGVDGTVLGTFAVYYGEQRAPTEDDIDAIAVITQTAALAIERHRSDLKLRRSQNELRALNADLERQITERARERSRTWQVTPDLLSVITMQGVFAATNPAWKVTLGWSEDELQAPFLDFLHPDDIARSLAVFEDAKRGQPVLRFENRYRHKDGTYRWLSWVGVLESGNVYCSARDITPDKENSALLTERTRERDVIWDASKDLLCVASLEGYFITLNPAWSELLDWTEAELLARPFIEFVHPDDRVATAAAASMISEGQPVFTFENRYRHRDGSYRWLSWNAVPRDGQIYATVRDMTSAKTQIAALLTAEEALRQAQKLEAVGQLTGGVAHDFNNLLTVIKSSTDLLKRPNLTEERKTRYIGAISDTVDRAAKLTGQLLAFARRQALRPEVFDVGQSVRNIGDMLGTLTGSRIEITLHVPDTPCYINADASQFDTALVNMAVNARDAMEGEGRLILTVEGLDELPQVRAHPSKKGTFVAVTITDTGSGIHPDQINQIFEPFFTTKGVGQGTGLGLSQVFGFAKQSGGEVMVESELGKGTTFTLYLPKTTITPRVEEADDELAAVDGEGTCVLVIEDNREVGQFSSQTLNELGYGTHLVANGKEALAELSSSPAAYHVVFSDVVMPGMNGVDLGREIQRLYPGLPIVLTSGYSSVLAEDPTHGFELLHKPYSVEQLSRILRRAVAKGHNRQTAQQPEQPGKGDIPSSQIDHRV